MQKIKILVNNLPAFLWRVPLKSGNNIYEKDGEIDNLEDPSSLKTDVIDEPISGASAYEIVLIKYIPALLLVYSLIYLNTYYPSMIGLGIASLIFVILDFLKNKYSLQTGIIGFVLIFACYISFVYLNYNFVINYNIGSISNYVIQYLIYLFILKAVFVDVLAKEYLGLYKIKGVLFRYVRIASKEYVAINQILSSKYKKVGNWIILAIGILSLVIGGSGLAYKVLVDKEAEKKILAKQTNDTMLINSKNATALLEKLDKEAKVVGLTPFHQTPESKALLERSFNDYLDIGIIGYEVVRISGRTNIIAVQDGEKLVIPGKDKYYDLKTYIKRYKGDYRWHFLYKNKEFVIMQTKAR